MWRLEDVIDYLGSIKTPACVCEETEKLYGAISDDFEKRFDNGDIYVSKANQKLYVTGCFNHDFSSMTPELKDVNVRYYVYIYEDSEKYVSDKFSKTGLMESFFDCNNKEVVIFGYYVEYCLERGMKSDICKYLNKIHEQYEDAEKVNRLVETLETLNDKAAGIVMETVLYTSGDKKVSIVQNFYSTLSEKNPSCVFDGCVERYAEYTEMVELFEKARSLERSVVGCLKKIGMHFLEWREMLSNTEKDIYRQVSNAFTAYKLMNNSKTLEELTQTTFKDASVEYGRLSIGIEDFYNEEKYIKHGEKENN